MRVRVYRYLRKACYSVQTYTSGKGWRVAFHTRAITLMDAKFTVSKAGRIRAILEQRKKAGAFVSGEWIAHIDTVENCDRVKCSPYVYGAFYVNGETEDKMVEAADIVILNEDGIYAANWAL